ncbi:MAG: FHA domain-containing protein, partial [Verrucomicrobia bacterium]|nr:FHA domain-containing protein [Verrucomicrobiota bacterium]
MAKLVVVTEGLAGLSHEVTGSWVTIGRAEESAFQIVEASVSGRHCEVRLQADELKVRDLGSTNGTFAHGERIT